MQQTTASLVRKIVAVSLCALLVCFAQARSQSNGKPAEAPATPPPVQLEEGEEPYHNVLALELMFTDGGFGLGGFYRHALTPDLSAALGFSISESKDDREMEYYDYYYQQSYTPGKLNRFLVLPLTLSLQYRLFREDIVETFRPYVNAGAGPALIYQMPFADLTVSDIGVVADKVDFFKAIGRGHPYYTGTAFVGFGANIGGDKSTLFGLNFRYCFTHLFSDGLPSLYNQNTGDVAAYKKEFGGVVISINIGLTY